MELVGFNKKGDCVYKIDVKNCTRCISFWMKLEEKYLPIYRPNNIPAYIKDENIEEYLGYRPSRFINSSSLSEIDRLNLLFDVWNLFFDKRLNKDERLVLATTFDDSLVKKEQLEELIQAFKNLNNIYVFEEQIKALE